MKKVILIAILILLNVPSLSFAQDEKKKALYFYADGCDLCDEVDGYFLSQGFYDKYEIEKIKVSGLYNMRYLNEFFDVFGVDKDKRGWPAVVLGEEMLVGSQQIIDNFAEDMEKFGQSGTPIPLEIRKKLEQGEIIVDKSVDLKNVSVIHIAGAAFVDSISPCSLAVVVILLSLMLLVRRKHNAFSIGIFFVIGVFFLYFLTGFFAVNYAWSILFLSEPISIIVGIIAILIGLFNARHLIDLKNFSFNEKIFLFEINAKKIFGRYINPLNAFFLGLFSNLFLIPCTIRPYLSTTKALAEEVLSIKSTTLLILYNFIFIIPMCASIAIVYFGVRNRKIRIWRNKKALVARSKLIHVIIGAVMIFAGIYLIQNWI